MNKSTKPLRIVWIMGVSSVLLLLIGALVKYELLTKAILHWIEGIKAR